ncbi:MAG: RNA polymerase sigma-54 factor [Clostridia bacterium]|nr:RNA polymerase sigma-54 factor [Clostridia bacterium]
MSLRVLGMSVQELREYLYDSAYQNPLLELDDTEPCIPAASDASSSSDDGPPRDPGFELDWRGCGSGGALENLPDKELSFSQELMGQLEMMKLEPEMLDLCRYIAACLNRRGWLDVPLEEISKDTGASLFDVTQALYVVQSLSPAGVGARDLTECLVLQLIESPYFNAHTIKLAKDGLMLLARNSMSEIAKLLGTDTQTARWAASVIRGLSPYPSVGRGGGESGYIVPDAVVLTDGERVTVKMNERIVPRPLISKEYEDIEHSCSEEDAKYLKECKARARRVVGYYDRRVSTIERVITAMVEFQPEYFKTGTGLRPMRLSDIAEPLELNVSTVCRAAADKYLTCKTGTVSLRSLFTTAIPDSSSSVVSAELVKDRIRKFITSEDPSKPLSDETLKQLLETSGVEISRRTVAKYRDAMGLPGSSMRRR